MLIEYWSQHLKRAFQATRRSSLRIRKTHSLRFLPRIECLEDRCTPSQVTLTPSADNTLFQDTTGGTTSDGAGPHLFSGETNTHLLRRAVLKFDLSSIPAGATITSASLTLFVTLAGAGGPAESTALHRLTKDWGEGSSDATSNEGVGTTAATNDATWVYNFFNTQTWTTQGGDFSATVSASTQVGAANTSATWTGSGLVTDVQGWLANSAANFGWIVVGNESAPGTAKQFASRENPTTADRPTLVVVYTPPAPDLTVSLSHVGIFHPGDSADTYAVSVRNIGAAPTNGSTVTVTDTLPTGLLPTAADSGTINGWTVSFSGQTVTATRTDVLPGGANYPNLTVTVSVANNIATSVINTVTVAGGGETNTANDTASDPTASTPLADLTISKSHIGPFRQGDAADQYTLTVHNISTGPTVGTVTITDTLPAGLAATAADHAIINGWTVSFVGQTITATRTDVLAGGASYPVLTLTVSVADHAPLFVTNSARVSGGGEIITSNDEVFDVTAILVHTQIRRRRGA